MTWIDEIQQMGANLVSEFRRIADESEARMQAVEEAHAHNLQRRGIIVRPMAGYKMPEWVRVSVGTQEQNEKFAEALKQEV